MIPSCQRQPRRSEGGEKFPMKHAAHALVLAFAATIASCATVSPIETPSGRPERPVSGATNDDGQRAEGAAIEERVKLPIGGYSLDLEASVLDDSRVHPADEAESPLARLERDERGRRVLGAIGRLQKRDRQAVLMRIEMDMSFKALAQALEFPSADRAREWWNSKEYAPAKKIRQEIASTEMLLVEGD